MAGDTGVAEIVTVVAALEAWSNVAVTIVLPPFSLMDMGDNSKVTVGASSSSSIVSVTSAGPVTVSVLVAAPETVIVLSGSSRSLSTAVIVTVPVLVVSPAAIVSVVLVLNL